jgi:cysteine desulfurase
MSGIYLDHSATTPVRPEVVEEMAPYFGAAFGNPSSIHYFGQQAKAALDQSRDTIASAIGTDPSEITFTGSGTEADNLALVGVILASPKHRRHLVTTSVEHDAVLKTAKFLESLDCEVTVLPVDGKGFVDPNAVADAIRPETALVSVLHGNNEVGTIQPIAEIARVTHRHGVLLHTDAVQTFGQLNVNVDQLDVDLLSMSAHKIYGPKGVGALYIRRGTTIVAELQGGGQERGRRSGTENVAGIVGFAKAVQLLLIERTQTSARMSQLRDWFIERIQADIRGSTLVGPTGAERLPNNINFTFENVEGEALLLNLDIAGIAASSGSACSSGSIEPSHVLTAMGIETSRSRGAIRFSIGRETTQSELRSCLAILISTTDRLRSMSQHSLPSA